MTTVRYVVIDDEPVYRRGFAPDDSRIRWVGGYRSVEEFLAIQEEPCEVVVLDLWLNRQTVDTAVPQGVRAIRRPRFLSSTPVSFTKSFTGVSPHEAE